MTRVLKPVPIVAGVMQMTPLVRVGNWFILFRLIC
jgi:hypothetical protein